MRAHLAELGIVAAQGRDGIKELLKIIASGADARLPVDAHTSVVVLAAELQAMQTLIGSIEKRIMVQHRCLDVLTVGGRGDSRTVLGLWLMWPSRRCSPRGVVNFVDEAGKVSQFIK